MSKRMACDEEQLEQFWSESLPPEQVRSLEKHLSVCEKCQGLFEARINRFAEITTATKWLKDEPTSDIRVSQGAEVQRVRSEAIAEIAKRMFDRSENHAHLGQLDEYEIIEPIGAGGMGIVFKGYDRELQRHVAIKLLSPSVSLVGSAKQRFVREAQAAASIVSPYVVPIHAVASHGDIPYIVMSYVPGVNLQELIEESGAMTPLQTVRIARQVALGLAAAHEQGLIHRDVKPGNILIERNGQRAVLTDFGLAQAADDASFTHSGLLAGTPNFMSPEQANGADIDERSDLFSLGSVMYAMLAGHPPFRAPNAYAVVKRLIEETPRPLTTIQPTTPGWLARLVMQLLSKDRGQRFVSAADVAAVLADCEKHLEHPSLHRVPKGLVSRSWLLRSELILGTLVLLGCIGFYLIWNSPWHSPSSPSSHVDNQATPQSNSKDTQVTLTPPGNSIEQGFIPRAIGRWQDEEEESNTIHRIEESIRRLERQ